MLAASSTPPTTMHRDSDFLPARGIMLARETLALLSSENVHEQIDFAVKTWGRASPVVQALVTKADVSGHEASDSTANVAGTDRGAEFSEIVDSQGLLRGLSDVPANVPFLAAVTDPSASWVEQSKAVPVSRAVLDRTVLTPKKIGSLLVVSNDFIRSADVRRVEQLLLSMMTRKARITADAAISDPSNTGSASTPAAVTSAATPIASTDDIANDALAMLAAFGGSLESACFWMPPGLAAQAGLRANSNAAGAGLGARGGTLAGLPVYCSAGVPSGTLILIDRASVALVDEGYTVARSMSGSVEMSDGPTGASDSPTAMSTKIVSLFQSDAQGALLVRRVNFHLANPAGVVVVTGANYAA